MAPSTRGWPSPWCRTGVPVPKGTPKPKTKRAHLAALAADYRNRARTAASTARNARSMRAWSEAARDARIARGMAKHYTTLARNTDPQETL